MRDDVMMQKIDEAELAAIDGGFLPALIVAGGIFTLYCAWKNAGN